MPGAMSKEDRKRSEQEKQWTQAVATEVKNWEAKLIAAGYDAQTRASKLHRLAKLMRILPDPDIARFITKSLRPIIRTAHRIKGDERYIYSTAAKQAQDLEKGLTASTKKVEISPEPNQADKTAEAATTSTVTNTGVSPVDPDPAVIGSDTLDGAGWVDIGQEDPEEDFELPVHWAVL